MWDVPVIVDRTILANRPDIVLNDKREETCLLVDMATPMIQTLTKKETEKRNKYKDLEIEVSGMWKVRAKTAQFINSCQ